MSATAIAAAFAAIGYGNLVVCEHWFRLAAHHLATAQQLTQAATDAFAGRPLAASRATAVHSAGAATRGARGFESVEPLAKGFDVIGLLSQGLPCLVADYAHDMQPTARTQ
jgi:hypothetical protein